MHWHPKNQEILISASDDNSIKIWASDEIASKRENQIESDTNIILNTFADQTLK